MSYFVQLVVWKDADAGRSERVMGMVEMAHLPLVGDYVCPPSSETAYKVTHRVWTPRREGNCGEDDVLLYLDAYGKKVL